MIFCLLMTTPYIIGGESAVRESEIPNAHSMVRKTVRRKIQVTAQANKNSQRKETLLIAGDEQLMPRANIDLETKELHSLLPLEVKEFQSSRSLLAYFIRRTLWSAGLSKTAAKKLAKSYFPSQMKIKRLAKKRE